MPAATRGRSGAGTRDTGGSAYRCRSRTSSVVGAEYGRVPVTHRKKTHVAAYTSVGGAAGAPFHCSGAMYDGVPTVCPLWPVSRAMPKSTSLLRRLGCTRTLPGL